MNKSAQFYLIAAIVLAAVIIGISSVANYSKKQTRSQIFDLKEELQIEGEKTLYYATKNSFSQTQIGQLMQNFTNTYIGSEKGMGRSFYFIYGDNNNITISGNQKSKKTIRATSGTSSVTVTQQEGNFSSGFNPDNNGLTIYIGDSAYDFNITAGQNFYFVVTEETAGGNYVITG